MLFATYNFITNMTLYFMTKGCRSMIPLIPVVLNNFYYLKEGKISSIKLLDEKSFLSRICIITVYSLKNG